MGEISGIIVVDKPGGWTSHDVVAKLRGVLGTRRIGHSGTLDPMATGVLVVFVGRASRAVQFAEADEKRYLAGIRLGIRTDTQDIWGTVIDICDTQITSREMEAELERFKGRIKQIPPMYSAVKVKGKKLYELARKGKTVEREPREVVISEILLKEYADNRGLLDITCSKGTYIRTLCNDIGENLKVGGVMDYLRRTRSGIFTLEDAIPLETIQRAEKPCELLRPVDIMFTKHPALALNAHFESRHRNGQKVPISAQTGVYRIYSEDSGEFLSLSEVVSTDGANCLKIIKSFHPV